MNPSEAPGREAQNARRRALREAMRERRHGVPMRERLDAGTAVAAHLLPLLAGHAGRIAGYWAVGGELPLHVVQANLPPTLRWCLPLLHADKLLRFREWSPGLALGPNRHGIPEPAEGPLLEARTMSVALLPLLAFDAQGNRLGQGGGWYDRSFATPRIVAPGTGSTVTAPRPILVGIGYAWQEVASLDAAEWDVPLDAVATPGGLHHFEARHRHQPPA